MRLLSCLLAASALSGFVAIDSARAADEWGSIEGQFVLEGEIPELAPLVEKGNSLVADAAVCAANGVPDDSLVVNADNKGVANICVWMPKPPGKIHPDLQKSAEPEVVLDQVGCRFTPRVLVARTDQKVIVKNGDPCNHNTNVASRLSPKNVSIQPNDRVGQAFDFKKAELTAFPPILVSCGSHGYMRSWWMVSDHPYTAVTDADGKFRIENLPAGEHTFRVWHERSGWIKSAEFTRELKVKVAGGQTTNVGTIKVNSAEFTKTK